VAQLLINITPAQTNLAAGNYTFTVTDANGCSTTVDVTITERFRLLQLLHQPMQHVMVQQTEV
jgi:hypothetical protein